MKTEPAWNVDDLGMPLPISQHACSVCLPTWDAVLGYEEGRDKVINRMRCGYPRFFVHPSVARLFAEAKDAVASPGSQVVVFPTRDAAQRAQRFVEKRTGAALRIVSYEGLQALIVPEDDYPVAMEYWRYTGEIISSRQAERVLQGKGGEPGFAVEALRKELAEFGDYAESDVFLYENGMSAIFAIFRAVTMMAPGKKTLQLEFPYVDALRVQNHFGSGVVFLNHAEGESFEEALRRIAKGEFAAVFCEAPSNPLLRTIDLPAVADACREGGVPLVVDDTTCSVANIQVDQYADIITTSLTKWVSGKGDVMAGQVTVCSSSPMYSDLLGFFDNDCPGRSRMFEGDARVLNENIANFAERMHASNENGEAVAEMLREHPAVEHLYYPKFTTPEMYERIKRPEGGYGGLLSFVLKNRKRSAKFFDSLQMSKGPSLGTDFSLACPFTLLAHYDELAWAEGCGLDRHLIRISVGMESTDALLDALGAALEHA
ncbi:PLP-dependent transferase [Oceaniferula marina]|uniref:PLP-dependent transferase n=1 Tax=Oceaniferula marina TaxID=2748318 RepID=UPI001D043A05|nr:PLP-dependent transferase [Oceaniferula marina]